MQFRTQNLANNFVFPVTVFLGFFKYNLIKVHFDFALTPLQTKFVKPSVTPHALHHLFFLNFLT